MRVMATKKLAYTVFLEPAIGDWAWVKNADDETMYVGGVLLLVKNGADMRLSVNYLMRWFMLGYHQ